MGAGELESLERGQRPRRTKQEHGHLHRRDQRDWEVIVPCNAKPMAIARRTLRPARGNRGQMSLGPTTTTRWPGGWPG
jgi:hypothetical protein